MTNEPYTGVPQIIQEPEFEHFFDPDAICLFQDKTNRLRMTIKDNRTYLDVRVTRAFPISDPEHYIGLLDARERCIGMLYDLEDIDDTSRFLIENALAHRYFIPSITRIISLKEEFGVVYCEVETDYGRREFVARGLRDSLEVLTHGQIQFTDTDGNRYRIASLESLDIRSQQLISNFI